MPSKSDTDAPVLLAYQTSLHPAYRPASADRQFWDQVGRIPFSGNLRSEDKNDSPKWEPSLDGSKRRRLE